MARHFKITYKDGSVREETSYSGCCSEDPSFFNDVDSVTETDIYGNTRTVRQSVLFPGNVTTYEGGTFHESNDNDLLYLGLGGVAGAVIIPVALAGVVVYGAGKLIYRLATIGKRRKEEEAHRARMEVFYKQWFEEDVNKILSKYNRKLSDYKELLDLGILTEQEYNSHVQEFIKLSTEEIESEKARLQRRLEDNRKKK